MREPVIIGVDVGNGYTKTVSTSFVSSVRDFGETKPAIDDRCIKYEGHYYTVGGERTKTKTDNKEDKTDLILALAAIAEELKARGIRENTVHIILSEGLPIERCIAENKEFDKQYYLKGQRVDFEYENIKRTIYIDDVIVNPQAASGVIDLLSKKRLPKRCLIVDIGSWTTDVLSIENYKPQGSNTRSFLMGVINCMLACNEEIRRREGKEVLESQIQDVMMGDRTQLPPKYADIVEEQTRKFVKEIADTLNENKYNTDTLYVVFMGGGASLVERYGKDIFPMAKFLTDIHANAIGYEQMARVISNRREG
ncbi:MAG: ParM/StbA family protein [Lachnospiraceae bacterium]|nr:ParM/StbA family protein [Lachnospiraceae bacterium]